MTRLTKRETQVAELIAAGYSDKQISRLLNIALRTARSHSNLVLAKTNAPNRTCAVVSLLIDGYLDAAAVRKSIQNTQHLLD